MKKSWLRFIAFLLVFALPIIAVGSVVFLAPSRFDETFLGEFEKKVDRLYETEGEKIVFIGGQFLHQFPVLGNVAGESGEPRRGEAVVGGVFSGDIFGNTNRN